MRLADILRLRVRSLFSRASVEHELDEEMQYHLERQIEEETARGVPREEARRAALRSIAGYVQRKEECRDMRGLNLIDNLSQDVRFAIRQLRNNLGFTCTAVFMLALGMCASVAIFAFVDAALIKPLPYPNPARLLGVFGQIPLCPQCNLSYPDYVDLKRLNTVFRSLDVYNRNGFLTTTPEGAQLVRGARISAGFFHTLGITPVLGRDFSVGEDSPGAPPTVILSYAAWQKRYGGSAGVLGKAVLLNGESNIIIGVLPRDFNFAPAEPAEFWTALQAKNSCDVRRSCHGLYGVARLKDGVSEQAALANVKLIAQQLEKQFPDSNLGQGATVAPLADVIVGNIRPILLVLLSGAGLLLLIASVNVASLLLVRSESRKREIALRSSLGASTGRIFGQFVTEGLVLVISASVLGLASAYWAMQVLVKLIPANMIGRMPFLQDLGLSPGVVMFAGTIALLAAALFSLTPVVHLSSSRLRERLSEGSRGSAGNTWRRLGSNLVIVELAIAMVLLVGAGLLGRSLYQLLRVDLGLQPDHLVTLQIGAPDSYSKDPKMLVLERKVISDIQNLPGVESVGLSHLGLPLDGNGNTSWFRVLGHPWHGEHNDVPERDVSSGYFAALGAKLYRGRYFAESEDSSKPRVAIINQTFSRQYFPGEDPIGKQITYLTPTVKPIEIVGIINDIKEGPLDLPIPPVLYIPFNQSPGTNFGLVVRTSQPEQPLLRLLSASIHQIDPGIVTFGGASMRDRIHDSPSAYLHRSSAWLVGGFAALALLLGVVGLYGVIAYSVSQRTREIGVRMALGAQPSSVYRLILTEAGWLTGIGIGIGLGLAVGAATLIRGLLFDVRAWDAPTLAAVAGVLGIASLLASYVPARRAASLNPTEALRVE